MTQIIWEAKMDDRWDCKVARVDGSNGHLTVSNGQVTILDEQVKLAYGATFGPDVADVADWQDQCILAVDQYES